MAAVTNARRAHSLLSGAENAAEHGDAITAARRLRTAACRFVDAVAEWHGIDVGPNPTPTRHVCALFDAGHIDRWNRRCLSEMLDLTESAEFAAIKGNIAILRVFMDTEPCTMEA